MTALSEPAPTPEDSPTGPIPGQIDLFTGKEHPHELFTSRRCPHKGCRRAVTGPHRHGLTDHWVCTAGHESIQRQGPR